MPELPEVEFAARQLRRWMAGRRIVRARAQLGRVLRGAAPPRLARAVEGRALERVERRGKFLLLDLEGGAGLLLHLGMTGKLLRRPVGAREPYSRVRFELEDGFAVHLRDPRKFGRVRAGSAEELRRDPSILLLGPDAWEQPLTPRELGARLARTRRALKPALMDQALIAGLGNIYAAEALFRAGIDPRRRADSLTPAELKRLVRGIRDVLRDAIATLPSGEGAEIEYVEEPDAPNPFRIYGKAGEPCPRCGTPLRAIPQAGRTTSFCERCQE